MNYDVFAADAGELILRARFASYHSADNPRTTNPQTVLQVSKAWNTDVSNLLVAAGIPQLQHQNSTPFIAPQKDSQPDWLGTGTYFTQGLASIIVSLEVLSKKRYHKGTLRHIISSDELLTACAEWCSENEAECTWPLKSRLLAAQFALQAKNLPIYARLTNSWLTYDKLDKLRFGPSDLTFYAKRDGISPVVYTVTCCLYTEQITAEQAAKQLNITTLAARKVCKEAFDLIMEDTFRSSVPRDFAEWAGFTK